MNLRLCTTPQSQSSHPAAVHCVRKWDASPRAVLDDADQVARHDGARMIGIRHILMALISLYERAEHSAITARMGLDIFRPRPHPSWLEAGLAYLQNPHERSGERLPLDPALPPFLSQKMLGRKKRGASLRKWVPDLLFLDDPFVQQVLIDPDAGLSGPLARLDFASRVANDLQADLMERVLGQPEASQALGNLAFRIAMGSNGHGPRGIAMFLGPPGVGKTLSARVFSESLASHGLLNPSKSRLLVVDLSQYSQYAQATHLFGQGSAAGVVTRHVVSFPESVILFDEMEKAHSKVLESFLTVLSEGVHNLDEGKVVDFRSCIFIFASNLGSEAWDHPELQSADRFSVDPLDLLGMSGMRDASVNACIWACLEPRIGGSFWQNDSLEPWKAWNWRRQPA